ncbi:hypothetical protein DWQ65_12050 [Treponema phagedenis]|uniref:Uncharacterized protein n=1 Tax=Treponema phagedenis TaxID=162 RepID=A0A0B7GRH4_TREPH|nr:hypothetical protein [Treponema phagedenis]QEJ94574.1 ABC transporter permease [Treponema phagedenis]QEK01547.1 ABC transporter permease [Treponema phagedenis]QEK06634.1 ABC transporter permease [Treponema phagedenis]QSH94206.1 hypothetical protein C5O78_03960 [Treponema phagedenis]QSI00777.1 hypothetical protein DWQ65_12050 [Treponema phagedenis]
MKNFLILLFAQVRRIFKNKNILGFFVLMPAFMFGFILLAGYLSSKGEDSEDSSGKYSGKYAVNINEVSYFVKDSGDLWKLFIKNGEKEKTITEAKDKLKKSKTSGIIIIPEDFSKK